MRRPVFSSLRAAVGAGVLLATTPAGFLTLPPGSRSAAPARESATAASPPLLDLRKVRPNEVGHIPILMYHAIGASASRSGSRYDRRGLNIAPDTFRKQLQLMYNAGWYPINMRDALTAHIDVPAGKTPCVLTFDDARGTQFRYRKDGTIDPDCAVGILEAFEAKHPEWPLRGSFYVLPRSKWNPVPFYQPGKETRKLRYLVRQGYEVANHSTSHRSMGPMDAGTLRWEMTQCIRYVQSRAPGATMDTMALPYGIAPRNHALWDCLLRGSDDGAIVYRNRCILLAAGDPAYPPTHKKFNPKRIMRIGSEPGNIERWIRRLRRGVPFRPYVSDGNPDTLTIPRSRESEIDRNRLDGARLVVYDDKTGATRQMAAGKDPVSVR